MAQARAAKPAVSNASPPAVTSPPACSATLSALASAPAPGRIPASAAAPRIHGSRGSRQSMVCTSGAGTNSMWWPSTADNSPTS